jgi:hypothetical protein
MPDYKNSKIYKLYCPDGDPNDVYYGATVNSLNQRLSKHKTTNGCVSRILFQKYKDKIIIELVENFPCNNKKELDIREAYYIRNNNCVNTVIPDRTEPEYQKEYRIENKDYFKEYRIENKEQIKEQKKEYYIENKEQIKEYYIENKEKIKEYQKEYKKENKEQIKEYKKEYYIENKEQIKEKCKEYRIEHKEKIKEKNKEYRIENKEKIDEKITCECGSTYIKRHKCRHIKTKKHQDYITNLK